MLLPLALSFFMAEWYSCVYLYHFFFTHSSVHGQLGYVHVSAVNCAAVNTGMHVSFCVIVLSGYPSRSGIAGSHGNSIFGFLRDSILFFPGGSEVKVSAMRETRVRSLGWEGPLEKEMATHSSVLAWRIPWTEEPGGLRSTGSQRVRND